MVKGKEVEEGALIERLVAINRVAKVVKGGRRFSFSALVVVGDGKGQAGHGLGKAREVSEAITKATTNAKRSMVKVPLREGRTLHHDVVGKSGAGKMQMRMAPSGTGIIAGGPARAVFEALGISDVVAKSLGSSNPHNLVRAVFSGLTEMESPRMIAARRDKKLSVIASRRDGASRVKSVQSSLSSDENESVRENLPQETE